MLIQLVKDIKVEIIFLIGEKVEIFRNIFRKISKSGDLENEIYFDMHEFRVYLILDIRCCFHKPARPQSQNHCNETGK